MKVLQVHNYYQIPGGEDQTVYKEKELLRENGNEVILYCWNNKEILNYSLSQKMSFPFNVIYNLKIVKEIREIIEREKPDIAHIHNVFLLISPSVYYALKNMNVPVVQTVHNYRFLCPNGLFLNNDGKICERCKNGNFFNAIPRKCYRNSYLQTFGMAFTLCLHRKLRTFVKKIDVFISPSKFLKKKLIEGGIPENKIVIKPYFVKCGEIEPGYEFGNYAVYMGRLSREKGLFTLFRAWKGVPVLTLKIIGEGPIQSELENFVIQEKIANVEFLRFIGGPKRFEILKKAMFMVFPSEWYENLPYAIIESFACGVPVVGSRIGGVRELIEDGVTGFFFEPGNVDDLSRKIAKLVENKELLLKMRHNARKLAEERYSEEVGYKNLMDVYKDTLEIFSQENV